MAVPSKEAKELLGFDYYNVFEAGITDKQRETRDNVREWVQNRVLPNINPYWEKAEFPFELFYEMKDLDIIGGALTEYGCAGLDYVENGLVAYELAKGDGSIGTGYGVHSGLALSSIGYLGSDEQKARWMPDMVEMKKIGAFGLTEPFVGSNAAGIRTTAKRDGDHYIINGAKRWIGNASISNILIVWARDDEGKIGAFVLEDAPETEGVQMENIFGKVAKRAVLNAEIHFENVRVPVENRLDKVRSFKDAAMVLFNGRYGVAWEAAGCAAGAFEHALKYALDREQFGKPIAGFQLIQQKLVEMASEVTAMQTMCMQLARNAEAGTLTEAMSSMAKYHNARKARRVTQLARETLGGNGIVIDNHIARLWTDAEVIYTYEGSNEINLLIVGRDITGINAFV
ncbi:MAG: acyl-CoA dehydrogenase family protein [Chloroflexota bacterium]